MYIYLIKYIFYLSENRLSINLLDSIHAVINLFSMTNQMNYTESIFVFLFLLAKRDHLLGVSRGSFRDGREILSVFLVPLLHLP